MAKKLTYPDGGAVKPKPKKAPKPVKPYNIDDEIGPVLKATSQFDDNDTFQNITRRAAKRGGVDPKLLFASSLQEGLNKAALKPDEISEAYRDAKVSSDFPVDGFYNYGLDRFSEMAPELMKKGYLPKDFAYKSFNAKNEKKEKIRTAAFKNNEDALVAKAAVLRNEKDKVVSYAKKKGVQLTPETTDYFTLASYNGGAGNGEKMIDEYQAAGGKGTDFITKDQTTRKGVSKNVLPRYNRMAKLADYFADGGVIGSDEDINKQFIREQQQREAGQMAPIDHLANMERLKTSLPTKLGGAPELKAPESIEEDTKKRYGGPNPFILGLTAVDMLLPKDEQKRKYSRPEDRDYYNPHAAGTGSQAIMKKGGKIAVSGTGIAFQDGGEVPTLNEKQYKAAKDTYYKMLTKEGKNQKMTKDDLRLYHESHDLMTTNAKFFEPGKEWNLNPIKDAAYQVGNTVRSNLNQLFDTHYGDGGKLSTYNEGGSSPIVEFKGPSHEEGGIPVSYQGQQAEVEGGETGFQDVQGDFQVLGNLKNPLTGRKFKNDGKLLAKQEDKIMKQMNKGQQLLSESDPKDPFERLKFNTAEAKMKGAKTKLDKVSMVKELFATVQKDQLIALGKADAAGVPKAALGYSLEGDEDLFHPLGDPRDPVKRGSTKKKVPATTPTPKREVASIDPYTPRPIGNPVIPSKLSVPKLSLPQATITTPDNNIDVPEDHYIASDAQAIDPANFAGEFYALATNKQEAVKAQEYTPELQQPFNISLQDRRNRVNSTFRAMLQQAGGNPAALATLAAQQYGATGDIDAEEFRINQAESANVYNQNRNTMNQAQQSNLSMYDQQYVRQAQAKSNTQARTFDAISSISDKILKNKAQQNDLRVMENLYDFRFSDDYQAKYEGSGPNFRKSFVAGINPFSTTAAQKEAKTRRSAKVEKEKDKSGKYGMSLTRQFKTIK